MEFWSSDRRFGLKIPDREVSHILKMCIRSDVNEIGGILVGTYTAAHDCAVVEAVSGAPSDSRFGRTWFHRGVQGLQRWLDLLWHRNRHYYLGEWHFHPHGAPTPSRIDARQMKGIANSIFYRCPEPVLLIIGGDPSLDWTAKAYVTPRGKDLIELLQE